MNYKFIFDMDDTLIHTSWLFVRARDDLVSLIQKRLGKSSPSPEEIKRMQLESELEVLKRTGFKQEIFPDSFQKTFEWYALQAGLSAKQINAEKHEYYDAGMQVNNPVNWEKELIDGAIEVLDFLRDQQDELYLVTAGDERVQRRKVNFYGLYKWFGERTYFTPRGKKPAIKEISRKFPKERAYFIGNSPSSDILPALESGINAIHIPKETWCIDNHPSENQAHHKKITIPRIREVIEVYESKLAGK